MRNSLKILALDPGKETGFAEICYDSVPQVLHAGSIKGGELPVYEALGELARDAQVVVMEQLLAFHGRMSGERYMIEGVIRLYCQQHGLDLLTVHPSTVKAFITGKGNAKKSDMRAVLKALIEIPGRSDVHTVDAVAVGLTWLHKTHGFTF